MFQLMKKTKANQVPNFILKHFSIGHIDRRVKSPARCQFMWTGAEWIPAPPNNNFSPINVQDSVVMGNTFTNNNSQNDIVHAMAMFT